MASIIAGAVAGLAIISQLETIYNIIDTIHSQGKHVFRHKNTCARFTDFLQEIRSALKEKASILESHKEARFSAEAKKRLDKLMQALIDAEVLLRNLQSWARMANYTGEGAKKIRELRQEIHESVTLLTFHMIGPPESNPQQPSPRHNTHNTRPNTHHSGMAPQLPSNHHHPLQSLHQQSNVTHHHQQSGWSSHRPSPFASPGRPGHGHAQGPIQNMFCLLNPYLNPSAEYAAGFKYRNISQK